MNILILHGPNLNLLGEREPLVYGKLKLKEMNSLLRKEAKILSSQIQLRFFQKNGEGELIDILQKNRKWADGLVINPGAYTHYSYALRDAITSVSFPTVEVHLTDLNQRAQLEPFRKKSVLADVCAYQVMGLGWKSYLKGIEFLLTK